MSKVINNLSLDAAKYVKLHMTDLKPNPVPTSHKFPQTLIPFIYFYYT